jgi:hypothetical protein
MARPLARPPPPLEVVAAVVWARGLLLAGPRPKAEIVELAQEQGLSRTRCGGSPGS